MPGIFSDVLQLQRKEPDCFDKHCKKKILGMISLACIEEKQTTV